MPRYTEWAVRRLGSAGGHEKKERSSFLKKRSKRLLVLEASGQTGFAWKSGGKPGMLHQVAAYHVCIPAFWGLETP
jgi:hypothetical protein